MKTELEKLIEKWESEKGSYIPNAPIYQAFIDEAKEALKREKQGQSLPIDNVSGCLPDESELAEAVDTAIYKSDCSTKTWIKEFKEQLKLSGYEIIETNNR